MTVAPHSLLGTKTLSEGVHVPVLSSPWLQVPTPGEGEWRLTARVRRVFPMRYSGVPRWPLSLPLLSLGECNE